MSNENIKEETTEKSADQCIIPIPDWTKNEINKIVQNDKNRQIYGEAKQIYKHLNYEGEWIFCSCLYEKIITEKVDEERIVEKFVPYHYNKNGWFEGYPDSCKLPLYHEEKLRGNESPILVVSNEKLANIEIENYILISPILGIENIMNSINYLKNHKIIVWPDDNSNEISFFISVITKFYPEIEILSLKKKQKKWTLQDAIDKEIDIKKFIENCARVEKSDGINLEKYYSPYEIFHIIRQKIYGSENLEQLDGIFYIYNENKYFWQERLEVNIKSDIQKWIEINYIKFLQKKDITIHTYLSNVKSFLANWSRRYYTSNPFKESVLQPYIHLQNGAIEITDTGFIFHNRNEKKESFFRDLYPLHCLDFDFEMKYYKENNIEKQAPTFYYYLKSIIPRYVENNTEKYQKELQLTIDFFSQVIAYCLSPIKRKPRFFAMYGGQNTGKSFFIELLETIIGEEFFVNRKIKDMENRFAAADLWGSKVYCDDDVKSNITLPDDFIKNYTGQKSITIEKKNKDAIKGVRISVAMFFISNHSFTVSGGIEGIERRLIYIPYKKKIQNPDVFLKDKIIGKMKKGKESKESDGKIFDERPAIIGLALRGLDLFVRNNNDFIMPEWINQERQEWIIQSNSITQFLHEIIYPRDEQQYSPRKIYDEYKDWCKEEDRRVYGRNNFYEKLKLESRIEFKHTVNGDAFLINKEWDLKDLEV